MPFSRRQSPPRGGAGRRSGRTRRRLFHRLSVYRLGVCGLALLLGAPVLLGAVGADPAVAANRARGGAALAKGDAGIDAAEDPAVTEDAATADGEEDPTAPQLVVAPQDPALAVGAESYVFDVLVRNPGEEELPAGALRLTLDTQRIGSSAELAEFSRTVGEDDPAAGTDTDTDTGDGENGPEESDANRADPETATTIAEVDVTSTDAGGQQEFTIEVERARIPLDAVSLAGVYGIRAELVLDDAAAHPEPITATTTAVWRSTAFGLRAPLTLVVPLVLPDDVLSMPNRNALGDAAPRLDALLTEAEQWQATLAIDPRLIAGIRAYGDAAPETARDLLEHLERSELPMFLLQFADADPAVQAALGFSKLLQPIGLSYITRNGSFTAPEADEQSSTGQSATGQNSTSDSGADPDSTETDSAETDSADPSAPSLAELLDWPDAMPGAWPAGGDVDADTLALLTASGIDRIVLDDDNVTGARTARAQVGGFDALIADTGLGGSASAAISGESAAERAGALAEIGAQLAVGTQPAEDGTASGAPEAPRPRVLALDRAAIADAEDPERLMQDLATLGWVRPVAADDLSQSDAELKPGAPPPERTELLAKTLERSEQIEELAPLLENPGYLVQYQRVRVLNSLATRRADPATDFAAFDRNTRERDATLLTGVQVVPSENTQLVGTSSNVPVLVHNALPFDAAVTLRTAPTSAGIVLSESRFPEERVDAEGNTTVLVPVRSRVSSGVSGLLVEVADARDDTVYSSSILLLTIRSAFETILLITLGALAAALLGFGVWRSIHRRRQSARAQE